MARSGLTGGLSPVPAGRACSRALSQRASRTEMPLPRHPSTRPDRPRPTTKGHALEASPQRLHANVRRPNLPQQQITQQQQQITQQPSARYTEILTVPINWLFPGDAVRAYSSTTANITTLAKVPWGRGPMLLS